MLTLIPLLISSAAALPGADATWTRMSRAKTLVECTEADGQPFCRSTAVFTGDTTLLIDTLANMKEHAHRFESIVEINALQDDIMHVVIDFPSPLSDRDYVARYTKQTTEDGSTVITWEPMTHPEAPASEDRVRLSRFAGSWTLTPVGEGQVRIQYLWQAEYGGSLPTWTLNTARKKTGAEAIKDLAKAAGGLDYRAP